MVFSSIAFLFFFLPAVIGLYQITPRSYRNGLLLAASLVFYVWGAGSLVLILLVSIGLNFASGWLIERGRENGHRGRARASLAVGVLVNVGLLAWFKYATFVSEQANSILGELGAAPVPALQILLPIGISFYTFHSLSYLIDIYRGVARHLANPIDFGLYITFFPQLVAGPIVRFHEIRDQLTWRREETSQFARGVFRFAHGLGKKVLIADTIAPLVDAIFATPPEQLTTFLAVTGAVAYATQLYFDFSGYSDMAIGIAAMFGIRLPENFDRPYAARSITEFWRRWHMSLSRWFRDYLYIPLGGNRGASWSTYRNLILVFLATGIWHGANWTFVVWGAYHGVLLLSERVLGVGRKLPDASARGVVANARTVALVTFGWILFRSPDMDYALGYIGALARPGASVPVDVALAFDPLVAVALAIGIGSVLLPGDWVTGWRLQVEETRRSSVLRLGAALGVFPLALVFVVAGEFSPFLYFQF
jgi:alginate O-acetyltransferase complex protein AlgI